MSNRSLDDRRSALAARLDVWEPRTLDRFLSDSAREFGDRPLVITDDGALTYAEVAAQAHLLGAGLAALGVRPATGWVCSPTTPSSSR